MNKFFLQGFLKTADAKLVNQSASGQDWDKPAEHRHKRQNILEFYAGHDDAVKPKNKAAVEEDTNDFKKGFRKTASPLHLVGIGVLPSIEKRIAEDSFEYSKRKAMGLDPEAPTGWFKNLKRSISKKVDRDLDWMETLDESKPLQRLRKRVNRFLMSEGPGVVAYAPAEQGRNIGKMLKSTVSELPPEMGSRAKEFATRLTSSNPEIVREAVEEMDQVMGKVRAAKEGVKTVKRVGGRLMGYGALAALGAAALRSMAREEAPKQLIDKKEELEPLSYVDYLD